MTANDENQTNSQRDPDDSGTPLPSGSARDADYSTGQKDEWIDDLGPDEFDELEDGPAAEMGKLPSPRAWDESVESAATGIPPQRKTSSTFDDLPTYEQRPDESSDARKILSEDSGAAPAGADAPREPAGFSQAGSGSTGTQPDPSLIKPGFDEQEQSIHLDAAQLARLAYAIEETPSASSGIGVRHEGAMDAAQLAQLAFAIEDDPGRAERANDADSDSDHLARLAKAIQGTRRDVNQPAEPMEPTKHQMKYTFDDLAPVDKNLLKGTSGPSAFAAPSDSRETTLQLNRENEDVEKTLKLSREEEDAEKTLKLGREEEDVEETLKTSPKTNNPLTNSGSLNLPLGVIDNEVASSQPTEDGGEATLRLRRNEGGSELRFEQVGDDRIPQSGERQPPAQVDSPSQSQQAGQDQQTTSQTPQPTQLPPVLGQLIKRSTIDAEPSLDAESLGSETFAPDSLQPGGFDVSLTDGSSGIAQAASQARTGFGRILSQRSGASQSESQMPAQQPLRQGAIPPLPTPGVVPDVPPNISQSQLPAQSLSGQQQDVTPPQMVPGQMSSSSSSAVGAPPLIPGAAPSGALPPQPGAPSAAVSLASQLPETAPGAAPSAQPPGTAPGAAPSAQPAGTAPGAAPSAQPPGTAPGAAPSAQPAGTAPGAAPSAQPAGTPPSGQPSASLVSPQLSSQTSAPPVGVEASAPLSVPPLGPLSTASQPAPTPESPTTLPPPPPPPAPDATPFASQNPRTSATDTPHGPAPFGIPAPEHRTPPFVRTDAPSAGETVVTGDVPPVVTQQTGFPQQPATRQSQAEPLLRPSLGAPQQTSQVGSGLIPANGDSTFEIPLLDREVAATANTDQDPSVVFFGKREAVLVRHAPSLSYKPSAKKATSQSFVELLTTKPQLEKRDLDDTTGENILVNNTPLVKISQGLSGAHPAQIPQAVPAHELPEPEPVEPGFNAPNMEILLSQASQKQVRIGPADEAIDGAPPVPTTPIDQPLQLDRPPRRDRPSTSRSGMRARGPVLLRGSGPDIQEGSQEQSVMPSEQGAVMPANRTPLILGGIVVVCMVVGLFAGSIFMSKKKEDAPPVVASSLTRPEQSDSGAPEEPTTYKRAFAAEQQKDYTKALKLYSSGLTEKPDDPDMWSGRGRVLTHEGQFVRAESDIRKALELSPGNKKVLLDLAALFYYKKDYEEAVKQYNAIIKKQPNSPDALFGRGLTLVWLNKRKEAIKDFQKVITLNPKHVLAYKQLAVEYMEAGDARQAIKVIDAGLLNAAMSEELFFERALASYKLGKKEDAVEDYTKAIKLNSNRKDFFNDRGFVRLELRQYSGAIEDFKRALEIDPGYTIAQDNLARAKKEQNE